VQEDGLTDEGQMDSLTNSSGRVIWIVASKGEPGGQTIPANVLRFQSYDNVTTRRCMCAVSISSKRVLKARFAQLQ